MADTAKLPFDIDAAVILLRAAVAPFPKAAMFALAQEGFAAPFEQLVACILSIRSRDEVSGPAARRLFAAARTPAALAALAPAQIDALIGDVTFHERKAAQIQALAQRVMTEFAGALPCDPAVMQTFAGVGPKCAHLAAGVACGYPRVSADIHVHRVTNRWGYVHTRTPEATGLALEAKLPPIYWIEINALLVPFGKHICQGVRPRCSACPLLAMCQQVGVTRAG
jgi:endonuclease-3